MGLARSLLVVTALLLPAAGSARAHPLFDESRDRFISVRLEDGSKPGHVLLTIDYRLEIREGTALLDYMYLHGEKVSRFAGKQSEFHSEYARVYSEIIARNLVVGVNGQPVALNAGKRSQTSTDETGKPLGHLRFDFQYSAEFAVKQSTPNVLTLREANFPEMEEKSKIYFTFENRASVSITDKTVPDAALYKLHATDRPLDFDSRIRNLSVRFVPAEEKSAQSAEPSSPHEERAQPEREHDGHDEAFINLYRRLRETDAGLWLILLAFAGLGGAHALTPGHGKTLVAAYLVGQNGTVWHAVLLGLVTTITHTAAVLIIALVLFFVPMNDQVRRAIQAGLGVVLGISVACLGLWLLLQRLSGRADHIHIGGGHDHHHHGPVTAPAAKSDRRLGLGGIIILGMNGGLIPCWDAVAILAMVAGSSEFWFALPALLAFSAGLASVLVALGILVVKVRDFAGSKWGQGRIVRALPLLSAVVVVCMGIYLSYASLPRSGR